MIPWPLIIHARPSQREQHGRTALNYADFSSSPQIEYTKDVLRRIIAIGTATALAAVVLTLTLMIEVPSIEDYPTQTINDPLDPALVGKFDPTSISGDLDPRGMVEKYRVNSRNSKGQLIELYGDSLTPLPYGVTQVKSPGARVHLTAFRVLEMTAKEGTIVAPENEPRRGDFSGQVVLSLYESDPSRPPDTTTDSEDLKLRLYMEDARFDMELGQIECDGPVHLTSDRVDFKGEGLSLIYNDLRRHLDRLVILRGRSLRFKPTDPRDATPQDPTVTNVAARSTPLPTTQPASDPDPAASLATTEGIEGIEGKATQDSTAIGIQEPIAAADDSAPTQAAARRPARFYRARFEDHVTVRSQGDQIDADRLEVVFSLDAKPGSDRHDLLDTIGANGFDRPATRQRTTDDAPGLDRDRQHHRVSTTALVHDGERAQSQQAAVNRYGFGGFPRTMPGGLTSWMAALPLAGLPSAVESPTPGPVNAVDPRSLITAEPDDVVIIWDGRLIIEPEDSPPIDLTGPDDLLIQLVGQPVRMKTQRHETILAASAEYTASGGRLRMIGSNLQPLRIESPQLGVLTGQRLEFDRQRGFGVVLGPGRLLGSIDGSATPPPSPADDDPAKLLTGASITWRDRMELSLFVDADRDTAQHNNSDSGRESDGVDYGIDYAVREATFRGGVGVVHPRFELTGEQLVLGFARPIDGSSSPGKIQANGDVHVTSRTPAMDVDCQSFTIELTRDDAGRVDPSRFLLTGQVRANQPQGQIRCDWLEVLLTRPSIDQESAHSQIAENPPDVATTFFDTPSGDGLQVSGVTAKGAVRARLDEPATWLAAGQVIVDPQLDQIQLFSASDQLARLDRLDASLSGGHIVMNRADQSVHVTGPGSFMFINQPEQSAADSDDPELTFMAPLAPPQPVVESLDEGLDNPSPPSGSPSVRWVGEPDTDRDEQDAPSAEPDPFIGPPKPQGPSVEVTWTQAMRFDDRQGLAHFVGKVQTRGQFENESVRLSADDLRMEFVNVSPPSQTDQPTPIGLSDRGSTSTTSSEKTGGTGDSEGRAASGTSGVSGPSGGAGKESPLTKMARGGRVVSSMIASKDVDFLAETWSDHIDGSLETRLRVAGPTIVFDNTIEQIQVIGPGHTLIEDYRPEKQSKPGDPNSIKPSGENQIGLFRRGVTLTKWAGRMVLDAAHNDMRMDERVQILHRPSGGRAPMQIDCQNLVVDLEATGGLGTWLSGQAPTPQVKGVYANRQVRLMSAGRVVFTDQLSYTGFDQVVELKALPGRLTRIHDDSRPNALTAQTFHWDLAKNRIEIVHPGGGRMPVR